MTQSGLKKPTKAKVVETEPLKPEIKEPVVEKPKTELDILIDKLKEEKPTAYEQYIKAVKAKKSVAIYPDLSLRIG